jgi:multiple sugar transport system substrate-binding protein
MKKNVWKSVLSLFLTLVMVIGCVIVFTGCQKKPPAETSATQEEKSSEPSASQEEGSSTSSEASANEKPYAGTTIKVLVVPHPATEPAKQFIPEFEAATGIKVDVEYLERIALGTKQEMELGMQ